MLVPTVASADTLTLTQYRQRIDVVHRSLAAARTASVALRAEFVREAKASLGTTTALTIGGQTVTIDDTRLADFDASDASLDSAIARLDAHIVLISRLDEPSIDPAVADARLRDVVQQGGPAQTGDLFDLLGRLILRFLSSLNSPAIDPNVLWPAVGGLGVAAILFIIATLGRALPERVRSEVLARDGSSVERLDPAAHLRAADDAIAAARRRDAMHELFLYTVNALADREAIRYDAALTDRELVLRAAAIPHADAFRALVATYERAWFGMHDLSEPDIRHARELALRVAP